MELLRALAALAEPPGDRHPALARALALGEPPVAAEQTELFSFELFPYASVYLGEEGMIGSEARDRIAGFWRVLAGEAEGGGGLAVPPEPDHLVVLLALQTDLAEREAEASGAPERAWRNARRALLWEHLASWLPAYLARLDEVASPFYRRWGALVGEALAAEAAEVGTQDALSVHLTEAAPIVDPSGGEGATEGNAGESFLAALLAPARTGMILCRADLRRAAADLGLGGRIGERRFVLRALLAQSPAAVLGWLAGEAKRQSGLWRSAALRWPAFARTTEHWADRADRSSALLDRLANESD